MVAQIAQLTVPSDGIGDPAAIVPDWDNGRIYFVNDAGLRRYNVALETQAPAVSVTVANTFTNAAFHDTDPVTGSLVVADGDGPVHKYDPLSLALTGTYSAGTVIEGAICAGCGTVASGGAVQRGYAVIKRSIFSGEVDVIFTDTMSTAGAVLNVVSGSVNNRGTLWRGPSGAAGATIFAMGNNYGATPLSAYPIWAIDIAPGAELHTSSNPNITVRTVGNVSATAIDPAWSTFTVQTRGYDHTDGNILLDVSTGDAVSHTRYVAKVNAATAAVIWSVAVAPPNADVFPYSNVRRSRIGLLPGGGFETVATNAGTVTTTPLGGLTSLNNVMSDDASGLLLLRCTYASGVNAPVPITGTPSSFTDGYALIGGLLLPPDFPLIGVVKVLLPPAELQFCDANGVPYAGGTLTMYEVGTTTPKDTWSDPAGASLNSNPIVLDSAGRALIYGDGAYRTILKDAAGNQIWDQPSFTYVSACMVPVVGAADLATARDAMGITAAIAAEAAARAAADSTEQAARIAADANLQAQITAEIARAEAAEAALGARIDGLPPPAPAGNTVGGLHQLDSSGYARVTFAAPFATSCTSVVATPCNTGNYPAGLDINIIDRTAFECWGYYAGTRTVWASGVFSWLAIGT